ncbi:unnamed protein product [Eruca vesicaria subsp. sativa]|uniref:Uncharacterized protein n=1 Tax=Eruca vesicaria subsp. sativa TaxID=29727 RepID=A0ABC8M8Y9_ERUVS|nr:unnamed protein product [Eruca vesicaria subsp. sativa]
MAKDCFRHQRTTLSHQVQVSNWEPSFQLQELLYEHVQLTQKATAVNVRHLAYQLFVKMLLRNGKEQYNNQKFKTLPNHGTSSLKPEPQECIYMQIFGIM